MPALDQRRRRSRTTTAQEPKGKVTLHRVRSAVLGNERRAWIYTPHGYTASTGEHGLLLLFDGWTYTSDIPTPAILDRLIAEARIPPLVAIMLDSLDEATRDRELPCYPPFVAGLADELLPWARQHYRITSNPARIIAGGSSYGGLAAAFAALTRPDTFGKVLSQSGSFWWKPEADPEHEWLARQFVAAPRRPIEFFLSVGLREAKARITPHQLIVNRHMRDVLRAKGYAVHYAEYDGGHDHASWRETLADGLLVLASE